MTSRLSAQQTFLKDLFTDNGRESLLVFHVDVEMNLNRSPGKKKKKKAKTSYLTRPMTSHDVNRVTRLTHGRFRKTASLRLFFPWPLIWS